MRRGYKGVQMLVHRGYEGGVKGVKDSFEDNAKCKTM